MKVVISGGGTGGHIYPALAIAGEIRRRAPGTDILYVGTEKGLESSIVPKTGLKFQTIDVSGIDRSSMIKASRSLIKFPRSFFQGWDIIKSFRPDIVIGTGGYVSFPVVLAATFAPGKTFIHEQNAIPGLANRNLAKRVDCVFLTFAEAASSLEARCIKVTGLPVRHEILEVDAGRARQELGLQKGRFTLLVFGGSRGAMSINRAMLDVLPRCRREDMQVLWITGESGYDDIKKRLAEIMDLDTASFHLRLYPYMPDIPKAMAVSDLAVCRAGASTISELAVLGLPAILVPYPYAADNHQEKNARALVDKGAVEMVIDEFLDGDTLYKKIKALQDDRHRLDIMSRSISGEARPDALRDIVDVIMNWT